MLIACDTTPMVSFSEMNPPLCAGLITLSAFNSMLKFLKPAAAVAILVYLQIKFPQTWIGSLGLQRLERLGKRLAAKPVLSGFLVALSLLLILCPVLPFSGLPRPALP